MVAVVLPWQGRQSPLSPAPSILLITKGWGEYFSANLQKTGHSIQNATALEATYDGNRLDGKSDAKADPAKSYAQRRKNQNSSFHFAFSFRFLISFFTLFPLVTTS